MSNCNFPSLPSVSLPLPPLPVPTLPALPDLPSVTLPSLDADLPRRFGKGAWDYARMRGYTSAGAGASIVPARFNCPPEITLHRFIRPSQ